MIKSFSISATPLTIEVVRKLIQQKTKLQLSAGPRKKIKHCRKYLEKRLAESDELIYGINTGFGSLCNIQISEQETTELQSYLIQSHACGMGDEVPSVIVRIILFLKIQNLSLGYSGVRLELVERLIDFYNQDVLPQLFQQGSLGASGDLAPLAHLSIPLIGKGKVRINDRLFKGSTLRKKMGWEPMQLKAKEGLALLNGTQFSTAYGLWACIRLRKLMAQANMIAAMSIDVFQCHYHPFDPKLHRIRSHRGQIQAAKSIRQWLKGSPIAKAKRTSVQDPYAFRCIPQVHGASMDALVHVEKIINTEINSVTDNPTIFPEAEEILSGGNFHAQPIALGLDYLAIACAEIGSISERRTFQLISGQRGLPDFLTAHPGLNSGLMIPQYTAASIVSQNKQLATPASVDSIVSSNGQEDHVSMAANAGTRLYRMVENIERVLAIELMTAAQGLSLRRPTKTSPQLEKIVRSYRKIVPKLTTDRILSEDMQKTVVFLRELNMDCDA